MAGSDYSNRNHKLLLALRHPLRREILRAMSDEEATSPRELAKLLGYRLTNISYHVKVLARCGAVEPARSKDSRGTRRHFYRWSLEEEWAQKMLDEGEGNPPQGKS